MADPVEIGVGKLTPDHFNQFPVWTWVDDFYNEDLVTPVLETDPIPSDVGDVFIKAEIWTPAGVRFDGNIIADTIEVSVVELDVPGLHIGFNLHPYAEVLNEKSVASLRRIIGDDNAQILPLTYRTTYQFEGGELISGVFDPYVRGDLPEDRPLFEICEEREVEVELLDGKIVPAKFVLEGEPPEKDEAVKLSLQFEGRESTKSDNDYFAAMCSIRRTLEAEGIVLRCYGASRNVYLPPTSRFLWGTKAYKLQFGLPSAAENVVSIFDLGEDFSPASVDEQKEFYKKWIQSLG